MAQQISEIKASARPRSGKGGARSVRREGRVPGVVYGNGAAENRTRDPLLHLTPPNALVLASRRQ